MATLTEKRSAFRRLHAGGCFVMPNPWDVGSARYLASLGFKALATTSAGFAWSRGLDDGDVSRAAVLAHIVEMAGASDLPINADFEAGFADTPDGVFESVTLCVGAGAAGLSIEDYPGTGARALYPVEDAIARVKAARSAIDAAGGDVILTARSEGFIRGAPDFDGTVRRLEAYAAAGADCLYAPGLRSAVQIKAAVAAVAPKPVNVLVGWASEFRVSDLAALGVRRISVGGALARSAWGGFMRAAKEIAEGGTFGGFADAAPAGDISKAFR